MFPKPRGQGSRIFHNLLLIAPELWSQCLTHTNRLSRNDMHERSPLNSWKYHRVDLLGIFLATENRSGMHPGSHKTSNVRHIHEKVCSDLPCNNPHSLVINHPGVGTCTTGDQLGLYLRGYRGQLIVINLLILLTHSIVRHLVKLS